MDELVTADINAYMTDGRGAAAEEYQIARQKVVAGNTGGGIILCLSDTRDGADRVLEHIGGEAGAVKAARRAAAVYIRNTEELRSIVQHALALCADRDRSCGVRRADRRTGRSSYEVVRTDVAGLACVGYLAPAVRRAEYGNSGAVLQLTENGGRGACRRAEVYGRGALNYCCRTGGRGRVIGCQTGGRYIILLDVAGLAGAGYLAPAVRGADNGNCGAVLQLCQNGRGSIGLGTQVYTRGTLHRTGGAGRRGNGVRRSDGGAGGAACERDIIRMDIAGLAIVCNLVPAAAYADYIYLGAVLQLTVRGGRGVRRRTEIYTARALYSAGAECNVGCGGAGQVLAADVAFLAVYGYLVPAGAVIQYRNRGTLGEGRDHCTAGGLTQVKRICVYLGLKYCQRVRQDHRHRKCTGKCEASEFFRKRHEIEASVSKWEKTAFTLPQKAAVKSYFVCSALPSQMDAISIAAHMLFFSVFLTIRSFIRTLGSVC